MASRSRREGEAGKALGMQARVLVVDEDRRELFYYHAILLKLGCKVRACSSLTEGAQCLGGEPFDLILVDQGRAGFEAQKVLTQAMEVDLELRVLVLAKTYNNGCYLEAMRSGALDYLEGKLSAADIVALLDTFMPRRTGIEKRKGTPARQPQNGNPN